MSDIIERNDFVPYTLEDFAVIIPHRSDFKKRWEWFWPQYINSIPKETIKNTVIVYHERGNEPTIVPEEITNSGAKTVTLSREGHSIVWPTLERLKHTEARLIARICDDARFLNNQWVEKAVELFNQKPHLKVLAPLALGGPAFSQIKDKKICRIPWIKKLLHDGEYRGIEFFTASWITNRAVWLAYYSEMEKYTQHGYEDVFFTFLSKADGVPGIPFNHFLNQGIPNIDAIRF